MKKLFATPTEAISELKAANPHRLPFYDNKLTPAVQHISGVLIKGGIDVQGFSPNNCESVMAVSISNGRQIIHKICVDSVEVNDVSDYEW